MGAFGPPGHSAPRSPGSGGRGGFQPCALDTGTGTPIPKWERNLVVATLLVHILDVGLDLLVVLLFLVHYQWGFFIVTVAILIWAWFVQSIYITFGAGSPVAGDIDDGGLAAAAPAGGGAAQQRRAPQGLTERIPTFFLGFVQWQIIAEAYECIFRNGDTDFFHTIRLMEALLESTPNTVVQLYALILWAGTDAAPEGAASLLRLSVCTSVASVGVGLAMWEHKVQEKVSGSYIAAVSVMRAFEICSRALTLAVFAGLTHPYGLWWVLVIDYGVMLICIARHQSVHIYYGIAVAIPLVLVSLEPLVWQREDHAVPKDTYFMVRIVEFVIMWIFIIHKQDSLDERLASNPAWEGCEALALLSTLGLYVTLLFVWRSARRNELSRDVNDWSEEGTREGLQGAYSDSEYSSSGGGSDHGGKAVLDDELPPE